MKERKGFWGSLEENLITVLLVIATLVVGLQAILKYAAPTAAGITNEISAYIYCYVAFIGLGYSVKYGADMGVKLFAKLLDGPMKGAFQALYKVCYVIVYGIMLVAAFQAVAAVGPELSPVAGIPMPVIYTSAIIGFALALVRLVESLIRK